MSSFLIRKTAAGPLPNNESTLLLLLIHSVFCYYFNSRILVKVLFDQNATRETHVVRMFWNKTLVPAFSERTLLERSFWRPRARFYGFFFLLLLLLYSAVKTQHVADISSDELCVNCLSITFCCFHRFSHVFHLIFTAARWDLLPREIDPDWFPAAQLFTA